MFALETLHILNQTLPSPPIKLKRYSGPPLGEETCNRAEFITRRHISITQTGESDANPPYQHYVGIDVSKLTREVYHPLEGASPVPGTPTARTSESEGNALALSERSCGSDARSGC